MKLINLVQNGGSLVTGGLRTSETPAELDAGDPLPGPGQVTEGPNQTRSFG